MDITLYEFEPTRSARVRWTLAELDLPFTSKAGREYFGTEELRSVHPMGKMPAVLIDGEPMFESVAICTHLADSVPDKGLIPKTGTRARALHEQWCAFALTEIEAHTWSTFRNMGEYYDDESMRVPAIIPQNEYELKKALPVMDAALDGQDWLLGDEFQVTDIACGYAVNNVMRAGTFGDDLPNLRDWVLRLREQPNCTLMSE